MSVCQSVRTSLLAAAIGVIAATQAQAVPVAPIYVDFGPGQQGGAPAPYNTIVWNNLGSGLGDSVPDLLQSGGASSGITATITDNFQSVNGAGVTSTSGDATEFWAAANDTVYLDAGGANNTTGAITLSNVAAGTYDLTFFASRNGVGTDVRSAVYRVTGSSVIDSAEYSASNNSTQVVTVTGVSPDVSGNILIEVLYGPNSTNSVFAYLGAVKIVGFDVPEPASLGLMGLGVLMLIGRKRRV